MATAIGIVSGVLGIVSFIQDNIAEQPPNGAIVRVKAGLEWGDEDSGFAGSIAAVYAWDTNNNYQGRSDGAHIGAGGYREFQIDQMEGGARAEYVAVSATKNAICIAWITVAMKDETQGGAWTGDIGSECGQNWYYSAEKAGKIKDSGEDYTPRCTWLDEDHSSDIRSASMKFAASAYGEDTESTLERKVMCHFTIWGPDNGPIAGESGWKTGSSSRQFPSIWLQTSATLQPPWGPDFIGSDGMFCDIGTKTITPICFFHDVDGCINVHVEDKTTTKRSAVAKRQVETKHKSYGTISQWS
ncbi:hypothetical protein HDV57DRAFT_526135 [Trichoderma longibrachiatum]